MKSFLVALIAVLNLNSCAEKTSNPESDVQDSLSSAACIEYDSNLSSQPDTCNNPDANILCCFINMPSSISHVMNIASQDEPGIPIVISGKIFNATSQKPYGCILMYAYHTDWEGYYSKNGDEEGVQKWHGKLHGWCKTDSLGNYEIRSIRPTPYPSGGIPAHIHSALKMYDGTSFYINDFVFADDPLANSQYVNSLNNPHNPKDEDDGIVTLTLVDSVYVGQRDILIEE